MSFNIRTSESLSARRLAIERKKQTSEYQVMRRHISPIAPDCRRGHSLMCGIAGNNTSEQGIMSSTCSLSWSDKKEIIRVADRYGYDWILGVACAAYARSMTAGNVIPDLMLHSDFAHEVLELGLSAQQKIARNLATLYGRQLSLFGSGQHKAVAHLYILAKNMAQRSDIYVMQTASTDELIVLKRAFLDRLCVAALAIESSASAKTTYLDQERLRSQIAQLEGQCTRAIAPYYDGRYYMLSPGGELLLAFSQGNQCDIGILVVHERAPDASFVHRHAFKIPGGVAHSIMRVTTGVHTKGSPIGALQYNLDGFFVLHPQIPVALYIDAGRNLRTLDVYTGKSVVIHQTGNVLACAISPDGKYMAWSTIDNKFFIREFEDQATIYVRDYGMAIHRIQWSGNGTMFAVSGHNDTAVINGIDGAVLHRIANTETIAYTCLSFDGSKLLIAYADGALVMWDVHKNAWCASHHLYDAHIISVQMSPDVSHVAITCQQEGMVKLLVWQVKQDLLGIFSTVSQSGLRLLHAQLSSGHIPFDQMSLQELVIAIAASGNQSHTRIPITENKYLEPYWMHMPSLLKHTIESKCLIV